MEFDCIIVLKHGDSIISGLIDLLHKQTPIIIQNKSFFIEMIQSDKVLKRFIIGLNGAETDQ